MRTVTAAVVGLATAGLLAGCSSGGSKAADWPAAFCSLRIGDTPSHVRDVMGKPNLVDDARPGRPASMAWWDKARTPYLFSADFLMADYTVSSLRLIDADKLTNAEKLAFPCGLTRSWEPPTP
jgi:hypothetical protein